MELWEDRSSLTEALQCIKNACILTRWHLVDIKTVKKIISKGLLLALFTAFISAAEQCLVHSVYS